MKDKGTTVSTSHKGIVATYPSHCLDTLSHGTWKRQDDDPGCPWTMECCDTVSSDLPNTSSFLSALTLSSYTLQPLHVGHSILSDSARGRKLGVFLVPLHMMMPVFVSEPHNFLLCLY